MKVELSLDELQEILEWCDGVEVSDMPWIPMEIPLYRKLSIIHRYQSSAKPAGNE